MLEERLGSLEARIVATEQQNKDLTGEITRLNTLMGRMDHFDDSLQQHRNEFNKAINGFIDKSEQRDDEILSLLRAEIRGYETAISDVRRGLEPIPGLRADLQARVQEEQRLARLITELQQIGKLPQYLLGFLSLWNFHSVFYFSNSKRVCLKNEKY